MNSLCKDDSVKIIATQKALDSKGLRIKSGNLYQDQPHITEKKEGYIIVCDEKGCLSEIPKTWCVFV